MFAAIHKDGCMPRMFETEEAFENFKGAKGPNLWMYRLYRIEGEDWIEI